MPLVGPTLALPVDFDREAEDTTLDAVLPTPPPPPPRALCCSCYKKKEGGGREGAKWW